MKKYFHITAFEIVLFCSLLQLLHCTDSIEIDIIEERNVYFDFSWQLPDQHMVNTHGSTFDLHEAQGYIGETSLNYIDINRAKFNFNRLNFTVILHITFDFDEFPINQPVTINMGLIRGIRCTLILNDKQTVLFDTPTPLQKIAEEYEIGGVCKLTTKNKQRNQLEFEIMLLEKKTQRRLYFTDGKLIDKVKQIKVKQNILSS